MKLKIRLLLALCITGAVLHQPVMVGGLSKEDFKVISSLAKSFVEQLKKDLKQEHKVSLRNLLSVVNVSVDQIPEPLRKFVDSIEFQTPKLRIDKDTYEIVWDRALVVGVENKISTRLYVGPGKDGSGSGFSLSIGIPGKQTMSTLLPIIKSAGPLDWFEIENVGFVLSSPFDDPLWGNLFLGLNFKATTRLAGPLLDFLNLFGKDLTTWQAHGILTPLGGGTEIRVIYPGKLTLFRWPIQLPGQPQQQPFFIITTGNQELRVGLTSSSGWANPIPTVKGIQGIEVGLPTLKWAKAGPVFTAPAEKDYIKFKSTGDFMVTPKGLALEIGGQMDGVVKNMFGFPGLDMGNLGLAVTVGYTPPVAVYPSGFSLKGLMYVGPVKAEGLVNVDVAKIQCTVLAKLAAMSHTDFAAWMAQIAQGFNDVGWGKIDTVALKDALAKGLPPFKIYDSEIFLGIGGGEVFDKRYSSGMKLKGGIEIFGVGGTIEQEISTALVGVRSKSWLKEIKIPKENPFIILSGAGDDKVRGTADDGPIMEAELSLSKQLLYMDGLLKIPALSVESSTHVLVNATAIEFDSVGKLAGLDSQFHVKGEPLKPETFVVSGTLIQQGLSFLGKGLQTAAQEFSKKAQEDLTIAMRNVQVWQQQAEKDIDTWINSEVNKVDQEINRLLRKLASAKNRCDAVPYNWIDPLGLFNGRAKACWEITVEGPWDVLALGAAQVHKEVTLKFVLREVAKGGVRVASVNAQLGLGVAKIGVEFARSTTDFIGKVMSEGFNITKVTVDGSLKQLVDEGTLPKVAVEGVILGKTFKQVYQVDFRSPDQLPKQIVAGLVQVFGPQPQPVVVGP